MATTPFVPDDDRTPQPLMLDPDDLVKLERLATELHNGTDRERDYGHRLWLVLNSIKDLNGR